MHSSKTSPILSRTFPADYLSIPQSCSFLEINVKRLHSQTKLKMRSLTSVAGILLTLAAQSFTAPAPSERSISQSPLVSEQDAYASQRIPTRYESTVLGRRLLALSRTGVLSTVFPHDVSSPRVPASVHDTPIGLPDYIASCEEPTGNPTLLALTVSTSTKNAVAGSNVSLALSWWDEYVKLTHHEPWSAANLPRLSMVGYLEEIPMKEAETTGIVDCFVDKHKDSRFWLPGDRSSPHTGLWMRMVVQEVYWIGGFGDRAFIGWFDPQQWHAVGVEDWEGVRLPGEPVD